MYRMVHNGIVSVQGLCSRLVRAASSTRRLIWYTIMCVITSMLRQASLSKRYYVGHCRQHEATAPGYYAGLRQATMMMQVPNATEWRGAVLKRRLSQVD